MNPQKTNKMKRPIMNPYKLNPSRYSTHRIIVDNIGNNKIVLDVGCNDGYLGLLADKSNIFYGVDYSMSSIKKAKGFYKDALVYDLNRLGGLPWGIKFDVIIFADVLEHVLDPAKVLFFITEFLKKDGVIIISLPNVANWQVRLNLLFGNFTYADTGIMDRTHLHFFTYKTVRKLMEAGDFKIIKELSGASFFGSIINLLPLLKKILATNIILICTK